jgi:hypothetical protein
MGGKNFMDRRPDNLGKRAAIAKRIGPSCCREPFIAKTQRGMAEGADQPWSRPFFMIRAYNFQL